MTEKEYSEHFLNGRVFCSILLNSCFLPLKHSMDKSHTRM